MDSLELIQTFCDVARLGNFAATARGQGVTPASVSKAIAKLEARFGVRLFNRTTRQVSLTDAGQVFLERSGALLELIDQTQDELHQRAIRPGGRLQVTAPPSLVPIQLPTMLGHFLRQYPEVRLQLHVTDRIVNLAEEGVDLAFRVGPIDDANLIVRRLLRIDYVAVATPGYWREHGKPTHPDELRTHAQLAYCLFGEVPCWHFSVNGRAHELHLQPLFSANNYSSLVTLARQGLGVVWGARRALAELIERGEFEATLEAFSPTDIWIHAAYLQRRHNSAALRALLAHLDEVKQAFSPGAGPKTPGSARAPAAPPSGSTSRVDRS